MGEVEILGREMNALGLPGRREVERSVMVPVAMFAWLSAGAFFVLVLTKAFDAATEFLDEGMPFPGGKCQVSGAAEKFVNGLTAAGARFGVRGFVSGSGR